MNIEQTCIVYTQMRGLKTVVSFVLNVYNTRCEYLK